MTAFIDASILIGVLAQEPGWEEESDRIDSFAPLLWSGVARWEAAIGLSFQHRYAVIDAIGEVDDFARAKSVRMVAIGEAEAALATQAAATYGKRTRHRAKLNMGDCFAYACAKANNAKLLYKGDDFAHTDLA